jgi:hypothetical protein
MAEWDNGDYVVFPEEVVELECRAYALELAVRAVHKAKRPSLAEAIAKGEIPRLELNQMVLEAMPENYRAMPTPDPEEAKTDACFSAFEALSHRGYSLTAAVAAHAYAKRVGVREDFRNLEWRLRKAVGIPC